MRKVIMSNTEQLEYRGRFDHPRPLIVRPQSIPNELKILNQWGNWKYKWDNERDDYAKPPFNPRTLSPLRANVPKGWGSFEEALGHCNRTDDPGGIGFLITRTSGIIGLDLDNCRSRVTGHVDPWAMEIVRSMKSYTSVSPSGTGLHIYCYAKMPQDGLKTVVNQGKATIEIYADRHYLTETGCYLNGTPCTVNAAQEALDALLLQYWPVKPAVRGDAAQE